MPKDLEALLAQFTDDDVTVRMCRAVFTVAPRGPKLVAVPTIEALAAKVVPDADEALIERARELMREEGPQQAVWLADALDTGDSSVSIYSGIRSALALYKARGESGADVLKVKERQADDAALKLLALAAMIDLVFPGEPDEKVAWAQSTNAGMGLLAFYASVEVALPFLDSTRAEGGRFLEHLRSRLADDAHRTLVTHLGEDSARSAAGVLELLSDPMEGLVQDNADRLEPLARSLARFVPAVMSVASRLGSVAAAGADVMPAYRFLGSCFVGEVCLRRAAGQFVPRPTPLPEPEPPVEPEAVPGVVESAPAQDAAGFAAEAAVAAGAVAAAAPPLVQTAPPPPPVEAGSPPPPPVEGGPPPPTVQTAPPPPPPVEDGPPPPPVRTAPPPPPPVEGGPPPPPVQTAPPPPPPAEDGPPPPPVRTAPTTPPPVQIPTPPPDAALAAAGGAVALGSQAATRSQPQPTVGQEASSGQPELPKPELPKPELPKPEPPKPEPPKPEPPKPEPKPFQRPEPPKPEPPKPEPKPKPAPPKPEAKPTARPEPRPSPRPEPKPAPDLSPDRVRSLYDAASDDEPASGSWGRRAAVMLMLIVALLGGGGVVGGGALYYLASTGRIELPSWVPIHVSKKSSSKSTQKDSTKKDSSKKDTTKKNSSKKGQRKR